MEKIQGRTMRGQRITVDGKEFLDCTLENCVLLYSGGPVVLERTILRDCKYFFFGPARGTVHFLQGVGLLQQTPDEWGECPDRVQ